MRPLLIALAGFLLLGAHGFAQTAPRPAQEVSGTDPQVTDPFTVADAWVVRWAAPRLVNISVLGADGSLVAGAAAPRGALYVAKGGTYHLQIDYVPPQAPNPAPANASNQVPRANMASRPYEIQVVQLSTALATPSRTMWVMPNYNLPGKGVANSSGLNGPKIPMAPPPSAVNGSSTPSTPPPDAGG